ncbi:MAG: M15 family metallopeptidase [Pseudomonadota bacterium]
MRLVPSILLAGAIVLAPLVWHLAPQYLPLAEDSGPDPAEAERASLRAEIAALAERVDALDRQIARLRSRGTTPRRDTVEDEPQDRGGESGALVGIYARVVAIADRRAVNEPLTVPRPSDLVEIFGPPSETLTQDCQEPTNALLLSLLRLDDVGPIRVRMIEPALESLRQIFANVRAIQPDLYERIQSSGSLCVRLVRGSEDRVSAHAYGLAVDINIDGQLDVLGDGRTQLGLTIMAEYFKREQWIWGASFGREDSMHFEVSLEKLREWQRRGLLDAPEGAEASE